MKEICNAIMQFEGGENRFVMCELEEGHEGLHKALWFGWEEKSSILPRDMVLRSDAWFGLKLKQKIEEVKGDAQS